MADVIPLTREARRSRRKHAVRSRVEDTKRMPMRRLELIRAEADWTWPAGVERPKTRADCIDGTRPCPFVACKHNLFLDVHHRTGNIRFNFPDRQPDDMPADRSCALDITESFGAVTLEGVGELMNLTRERTRQIETDALERVGATRELAEFAPSERSARSRQTVGTSLHVERPDHDESEEEPEDERSTMLLRGLNPRERDEAERFARTAATLVLVGWRPLEAWDRANELLGEVEKGDPMPFDAFPEAAPARAAPPPIATPPERRREVSPAEVEKLAARLLPKEEREEVDCDQELQLEEPEPGRPGRPRGSVAAIRVGVSKSAPAATPVAAMSANNRSGAMGHIEEVLELLKKPQTTKELAPQLSWAGGARLFACLHTMKKRGLISQAEKGGPWVRNPAPDAKPAKKPARAKAAHGRRRRMYESKARPDSKSNGHAPVSDFAAGLASNLQAMRAHYVKKIEAIDALLAMPGDPA